MENKRQNIEYRISNIESKIQDSVFLEFNHIPHSPFHLPHSPRTRGMSLLELLIYIAILSGLMVIISDAFISLSKGRGQAEARSEVNSAIRFAAERIKQDVKNASAISTPTLGTPANSLSMTVSGVPVVYDVLSGALRRTENGVVATTTGSLVFVDTPTFTRFENHNSVLGATTTAIQTVMTFRYNASSTDWVYADTMRTTVTLR